MGLGDEFDIDTETDPAPSPTHRYEENTDGETCHYPLSLDGDEPPEELTTPLDESSYWQLHSVDEARCTREVWDNGSDEPRCFWHTAVNEAENEPRKGVDEACRRLTTEAEAEDIEVAGRRIQAVLDGADLRHLDVHDGTDDLSFNACRLYKATFANADLTETDFRESVLWAADFRDAGLRRTDFRRAAFRDTVFAGATDLHTARFEGSNLGVLRRIGFYVPAIDQTMTGISEGLEGVLFRVLGPPLQACHRFRAMLAVVVPAVLLLLDTAGCFLVIRSFDCLGVVSGQFVRLATQLSFSITAFLIVASAIIGLLARRWGADLDVDDVQSALTSSLYLSLSASVVGIVIQAYVSSVILSVLSFYLFLAVFIGMVLTAVGFVDLAFES